MWRPLVVDECSYLIKCSDVSYLQIMLTDFKTIWVEEVTSNDLITRFQELNPLFDTASLSSDDLLQKIKSLINDIDEETTITLVKEGDAVLLELKRKLSVVVMKCKFNFSRKDENTFFKEFTIPLIQSVQYLEVRQKKLFDLLEKKDKEIQEHQLEGGDISRKSLITKRFDRNSLLESAPEQLFVNVFGKSKVFLEAFTNKFGTVTNVSPKGKVENIESRPRKKLKTEQSRT